MKDSRAQWRTGLREQNRHQFRWKRKRRTGGVRRWARCWAWGSGMFWEFLNGCFHFSFNLPKSPSIALGFSVNSKRLHGHPGLSPGKLWDTAQESAFLTWDDGVARPGTTPGEPLGLKKKKGDLPKVQMTSKLVPGCTQITPKGPRSWVFWAASQEDAQRSRCRLSLQNRSPWWGGSLKAAFAHLPKHHQASGVWIIYGSLKAPRYAQGPFLTFSKHKIGLPWWLRL